MTTMVTDKVASTIERKDNGLLTVHALLVTIKPIVIPPLWKQISKEISGVTAISQLLTTCNFRTDVKING